MSNLGRYQELVTEAKSLGGVENYLKLIEANAVASAAPRLVAQGAAVTLLAVGGVAGVVLEMKRRIDKRRALATEAEAARQSLTAVNRARSCAWCGESGHDRGSCDVSLNADYCSVCGYHGHDKGSCPRTTRNFEQKRDGDG